MVKMFLYLLEDIMGVTAMKLVAILTCFLLGSPIFSPFCLSDLFFCQVNVLKPSHKSTLQSKITETPVPDIVSAVHNVTNPTRDVDSELEVGQEGKIREIVMDNVDQESRVWKISKRVPSGQNM